jgi:hypothetical protein
MLRVLDRSAQVLSVVNSNFEHKILRFISNDVYRPSDKVLSRKNPVYIDQRESTLHRAPKSAVVGMVYVGSAVTVAQQSIRAERIIVGSEWSCRD